MTKTAKQVSADILVTLNGVDIVTALEAVATTLSFLLVNAYGDIALGGFDALVGDMRNNIEMNLRGKRKHHGTFG